MKENPAFREKFEDFGVIEIDIRRFLAEVFEGKPVIGIPIDDVGFDLREWAQTPKIEVRLWIIRKLVEFGNPNNVIYEIPEEYRPVLDTSPDADESDRASTYYDVKIADLMDRQLLTPAHQSVFMSYGPRGGERKQYEAIISPDGSLTTLGRGSLHLVMPRWLASRAPEASVRLSMVGQAGETLTDARLRNCETNFSN